MAYRRQENAGFCTLGISRVIIPKAKSGRLYQRLAAEIHICDRSGAQRKERVETSRVAFCVAGFTAAGFTVHHFVLEVFVWGPLCMKSIF